MTVKTNPPQLNKVRPGDPLIADQIRDTLDTLCAIHTYWKHPVSGGAAVSDPQLRGTPSVRVVDKGSGPTVDWQTETFYTPNTSVFSHFHATLDGAASKVDVGLWGGTTRKPHGMATWISREGTAGADETRLDGEEAEDFQGTDFDWTSTVVLLLADPGGYDQWLDKTNDLTRNWSLVAASHWGNYQTVSAGWDPSQVLPPESPENNATNSTWTFYPLQMGAWLNASGDGLHLGQTITIQTKDDVEDGLFESEHSSAQLPDGLKAGVSRITYAGDDNVRTYHWHKSTGWVSPLPKPEGTS